MAVCVTAVLLATGCGRPVPEVRFTDLVTDQGLWAGRERLRPRELLAADETWLAVTIKPGQEVTSAFALDTEPSLTLAGCLECASEDATVQTGVLRGTVETRGGRPVDLSVDVGTAAGWWRRDVDLPNGGGRNAELRLVADIPPGCVLHLREATVRDLKSVRTAPDGAPTQLLLISVDTLRHDAVAVFGGAVATPHLDRLAAESEVFTSCRAAASWTKPSHASMLTGLLPDTHRAMMLDQAMDPAVPTLAGRLQAGGLTTGALVYDCTWLSPRWGFGKGFDSYRVTRWRAGRLAAQAANWIFDHRDEGFFFFLHTFEPHADFNVLPYEAPALTRASIAERFGVSGFGCRGGLCGAAFLGALARGEVPSEAADTTILRDSYDAGVRYLDASLGELFEALRQSGVWDDLMVVVTSDHGEEFAEHGGYGHDTLHEEILRVPLIVKWPRGRRGGSVNHVPCSGIDVAPTLLAAAGLPADHLPGTELSARTPDGIIVSGTLEHVVVSGSLKGFFGGKGPDRLFDLGADPGETTDLAASQPETLRRLAEMLEAERRQAMELYRWLGSPGEAEQVELSEHERQRLRAFGYLD